MLGCSLRKSATMGRRYKPPQGDGCGQEQLSLWYVVLARRLTLGFGDVLNNAAASNDESAPRFRQHNLAV